jgi:site-specific recombinase XerD
VRLLAVPGAPAPGIAALSTEADAAFLLGAMTARERIISQLLRWTGLRLSEAVRLLDEDVDLARARFASGGRSRPAGYALFRY